MQLELDDTPDGVAMYVRDDQGRLVAHSGPPRTQAVRATSLRFAPQGGRRYRLYADLPNGFAGGSFSVTARAGTLLPMLAQCTADTDCDDASDCTTDSCDSGQCLQTLIDLDGDGYAAMQLGTCGTDCDDADDAVHPEAVDGCGNGDQDCDGAEDEDRLVVCHEDLDDDGFGSKVTLTECGACPTGYVLEPGDCFDVVTRTGIGAQVYPAQTGFFSEPYCDGADCSYDYDCDGKEQLEIEGMFSACSMLDTCEGAGWVTSVPDCGAPGRLQSCAGRLCTPSALTSPIQACH